jgi:hypothetical protein
VNAAAAAYRISLPGFKLFCADPEDQTNPDLVAPIPPSRVPQSLGTGPKHQLLERPEAFKLVFRPSLRARDTIRKDAGDLAGVLRHVESCQLPDS